MMRHTFKTLELSFSAIRLLVVTLIMTAVTCSCQHNKEDEHVYYDKFPIFMV